MKPRHTSVFLWLFTVYWLVHAAVGQAEGRDVTVPLVVALVHLVGVMVLDAVIRLAAEIKAALPAPTEEVDRG